MDLPVVRRHQLLVLALGVVEVLLVPAAYLALRHLPPPDTTSTMTLLPWACAYVRVREATIKCHM